MTDLIGRLLSVNLPAACFAVAAAALGHALQISSGTYDHDALWWVSVAFGLCLIGTLTHRTAGSFSRGGMLGVTALLTGGVLWQIWQLTSGHPGHDILEGTAVRPFHVGVAIEGVFVLLGVSGVAFARRIWFPLLLAMHLVLGVWLIKVSPAPGIDVVVVHKEAMDAFLGFHDPYRISFPNIYGDDWKYYYNPIVVFGNRIGFGYPYPPLGLLVAIPGYVMFGDYRYSELAVLIAAAALIGYSRRHLAAPLAAAVLLTTPRGFFVLEQGWTEPVTIFMLALTTFLLTKGPLPASWATGLMLTTKQYMPFIGLASLRAVLLDRRRAIVTLCVIVFTGSAVILPFALWHPNAFMRSVVWLQTLEPFRGDSLSYLSWADRQGWGRGSFLWAVGAATIAAVMSLFTTRNTPSGFATSAAITMFAMFVFGSKAFCNYYYFVIGALCCAVAAFTAQGEDETAVH